MKGDKKELINFIVDDKKIILIGYNTDKEAYDISGILGCYLNGLYILHNKCNLIHGDLKPLNICIDNGFIKLIDFGTSCKIVDDKNDFKNTIGWMTPVQFYNMFLRDFLSIKDLENKIKCDLAPERQKIETLLCKYHKIFNFGENFFIFKENPVKNDNFVCALIIIYIYTNGTNLWKCEIYDNKWSNDDIMKNFKTMALNIIQFLSNPSEFVDDFLKTEGYLIPENYKTIIRKNLLDIFI